MNETLERNGYPETLIGETADWCILLRQKQITLGSVILCSKTPVSSIPEISDSAMLDFRTAAGASERTLNRKFGPDKFNYVLLMMVDRVVHFHLIPRYSTPRTFDGITFEDFGWPKHPDFNSVTSISLDVFTVLRDSLRKAFTSETAFL